MKCPYHPNYTGYTNKLVDQSTILMPPKIEQILTFPNYICNRCHAIWLEISHQANKLYQTSIIFSSPKPISLDKNQYYLHITYEKGEEHAGTTRIMSGPHCNHQFELMFDNGVYSKCNFCGLPFYPPGYKSPNPEFIRMNLNNEFTCASPESFPPHFCKQCNIDYRTQNGHFEHYNTEEHFFTQDELSEIYSINRIVFEHTCEVYHCDICLYKEENEIWYNYSDLKKHKHYYHRQKQFV